MVFSTMLSRPLVRMAARRPYLLHCASSTKTTTQIRPPSMLVIGVHQVDTTIRRPFSSSSSKSYTLETLKTLRSQTGAPMVECKKALEASDNNLEAALDWLRRQGASKAASKLVGRETLQGLVGICISEDSQQASLVQVAAETDFAGRSKTFVDLVVGVSKATLAASTGTSGSLEQDAILAARHSDDNKSVQDMLNEAIVAIRENLSVAQAIKLTTATEQSVLVGYVHNRIDASNAGTSAALVELRPIDDNRKISLEDMKVIGKKLAMHVVAARPLYLSPSHVPGELVQKERDLLASQLEDTGKPQEVLDKIVEGRLRKFYENICLTEQAHMIEEKNPKVSDALERQGVRVNRFEALFIS